jgi:hypothetical protein
MATKKKPLPAPEVDMVRVRALEPIRADGEDYAPGAVFDLAEADAAALVAGGWAEPVALELPSLA